jgi:hypothetical protein
MVEHLLDCLVVCSRDPDIDAIMTDLLREAGHAVDLVNKNDLVAVLRERTHPGVVVRNVRQATPTQQGTFPTLTVAPYVTRRHGYVLLTLYDEWKHLLTPHLPADHDVTVLSMPEGLAKLVSTVAQVGTRVARRWE